MVVLTDLTPDDLAHYLPRTTRRAAPGDLHGTTATKWDATLRALRDCPGNPGAAHLAAVLTTPLMVGLARTVYSDTPDRDPAVLLDTTRFSTSGALEDHFLASFVPTVYRYPPTPSDGRRGQDPDRAQHWLGYLADYLDQHSTTGDLEWWRLGDSLRRSSRILSVAAAATLTTAMRWGR